MRIETEFQFIHKERGTEKLNKRFQVENKKNVPIYSYELFVTNIFVFFKN